jgi:hypothetical protein
VAEDLGSVFRSLPDALDRFQNMRATATRSSIPPTRMIATETGLSERFPSSMSNDPGTERKR